MSANMHEQFAGLSGMAAELGKQFRNAVNAAFGVKARDGER